MRRVNRAILITVAICCILFVGCNKSVGPDEVAKVLFDFYIQEDIMNIDKIGLTQEDAETIIDGGIKSFETELEDSLKSIAGDVKVEINKEDIQKAIEERRSLEKKLTAQVEIISKEKNIAQVKLYTTYFDEAAIYDKASKALEDKMKDVELDDEKAFVQQCMDTYIQEIIRAYKEAEVSTDTKSILVEFIKQNGAWLPSEQQSFIDHLTELTSGYEVEK